MEQQEKKMRTTTQPSLSSLPLDVTSKILSKLPAKSLVRSLCVSKLWLSITTDPYFINSCKGWPKLLFSFKEGDKFFVFFIPQHNQNRYETSSYSSCEPIDSYNVTFPKQCSFTIKTKSVNGLICFQKSTNPVVWNPSTREIITLPRPDKTWNAITFFLGYDPIEGKHKVVCLRREKAWDECRVLTLGSTKKSWRTVKTIHHNPSNIHRNFGMSTVIDGRCIKGVLYYLAYLECQRVIMRFDVKSEKLDMIEIPSSVCINACRLMIMPYEEKLAVVGFPNSTKVGIPIWVMEDAEKGEWSKHSFLPLSHYGKSLTSFKLIDITFEGELIYVPKTFLKSFDILYVDPKRETLRRVEYRGIVDDDFRQRNGLGNKRLRVFQFFPNHIANFISL